jgi:hypothetical protein
MTTIADGYGTLISPAGTFGNVLRLHRSGIQETFVDNISFDVGTWESYVYYADHDPSGSPVPLMTVYFSMHTTNTGDKFYTELSQWRTDGVAGMEGMDARNRHMMVYPNPAMDRLQLDVPGTGRTLITLVDAAGRTALVESGNGGRMVLDVHALERGIYMVVVEDEAGTRVTQRVVLQ